jgi:hypothetical protein
MILYGLPPPIARRDRDARGLFVTRRADLVRDDSTASFAAGWPGNVVLESVVRGNAADARFHDQSIRARLPSVA